RILLAIAAEVDALAELLHRGQVLDPVGVDRAEQEPSLDRARRLLAERRLPGLVRFVDEVGDLRVERLARVDAGERRGGDLVAASEQRAEGRGEGRQIPV